MAHWDDVYSQAADHSWDEPAPAVSMRLLADVSGSAVDVGAGQSRLVDELLARGLAVTVLDVSAVAMAAVQARCPGASVVVGDVLAWEPTTAFDAWHDRAVLHFLVEPADQAQYVAVCTRALRPGGIAVIGVFAPDGPTECSGLPTLRYAADDLVALFGAGFVLEHQERVEHVMPWGAVQPFTWAVLRRL